MQYNDQYEILFQNYDKARAFDQLAALFYDRNFSTVSKSEIELLMFSFYLEATIAAHKNAKGVLDYVLASDYEISKQLGITQEKVRNLKIKKQVRYPVSFDWVQSLQSIKDSIRYEEKDRRMIIPVSDPNLNIEIRNYITKNGGFVDMESSKDYIRIRIEYYLMLMYYTMAPEDKEKFIKEMKKQIKTQNNKEHVFDSTNKIELANNILSLACSGTEVVNQVISIFSPQNTLASILNTVLKKVLD